MHAIGTAHRCSACVKNHEVHENRHREVALLVAEYQRIDSILKTPPTRRRALSERSTNPQIRNFAEADNVLDVFEAEPGENDEIASNTDDMSTTTASETMSASKLSKAEQREQKRQQKAQRSIKKAQRNEERYTISITSEEVQRIGNILHGNPTESQTHPLATDKTIEDVINRNLGFVKQIQCHKQALYASIRQGRQEEEEKKRAKRRMSEGYEDHQAEAVIDAILLKLGVNPTDNHHAMKSNKRGQRPSLSPSKHDNKQSSPDKVKIVAKLRDAIKDDLEKHENDLRQTYLRAGGFFRYAGKMVFERMTEIAKTIDLQSGEEWEKKRKREARAVQAAAGVEVDDQV